MALDETLTFVGVNGQSINLTDLTNYYIGSRKGFSVPPQQLFHERLPGVPGARKTGVAVRERVISLVLRARSTGHGNALAVEHSLDSILAQDGYWQSVVNGLTRRLDVAYRGGLEGDTGSRMANAAGWPVLIPEYESVGHPYWYDPTQQQQALDLGLAVNGIAFPLTFPVFSSVTGSAMAQTLMAGDVGGPWQCDVSGPVSAAGSVALKNLLTGEQLVWSSSTVAVPTGALLRFDTRSGFRRIYIDDGTGKRLVTAIGSDSVWWQLAGGLNKVALVVSGGNGTNVGTFRWSNFYLAAG